MAVVPHEHVPERRMWWEQLFVRELWAFLAIAVIWLSVLFAAVYGPDIQNSGVAGDRSVVPSVVVVSLFAFLATWAIAAYGFRARKD
jgi:hypothetical protein